MSYLDAIRARHVAVYDPSLICEDDGDDWPCDTTIVLAALDERERQRDGARVSAAACQAALDTALARERRLREALEFDAVRDCWTMSRADYDALAETNEP